MTTLIAYHGKQEEKRAILKQLRAHRRADELVKGITWENGKGCAVGCTLHEYSHALYVPRFGIPEALARLEDTVFEGLPNDKAKDWPIQFMTAIRPGADLSFVQWKFLHWLLTDEKVNPGINHPLAKEAVARVAESARSAAWSAESAESAAWSAWLAESARSAAWSAESAAWSAAWSAESAARSAAWSARSAAWSAWSAESAAVSAAWSARSAARSAAWSAWSARSAAWSAWSAESAAESAAWSAWSAESARSAAWSAAMSAMSAAYVLMAEKLLSLLKAAPVPKMGAA